MFLVQNFSSKATRVGKTSKCKPLVLTVVIEALLDDCVDVVACFPGARESSCAVPSFLLWWVFTVFIIKIIQCVKIK
jgi:hypothetical protein